MSKSELPSQDKLMIQIATFTPDGAGIAIQEAAGQQEVVSMNILPRRVMDFGDTNPIKVYAMLGIEVTGVADALFYTVKLPDGWTKAVEEGDLHSSVLDRLGRKRIHVFYKAAFYDRIAHSTIEHRFTYGRKFDEAAGAFESIVRIYDAGIEIHQAEITGGYKGAEQYAEPWLNEHYPEWENRFAYWND